MLHLKLCAVALIGIMLLDACDLANPGTQRLTERDAGRAVELRTGDHLEIVLPGNPTTGYRWDRVAGDTAVIAALGEPVFEPDSSLLGSGGRIALAYMATAPGRTTLKLVYHRAFEPNVAPQRTFEVTIVVT